MSALFLQVNKCMDVLQIEMTPQRKNFLEKFAALLILRERTSLDLRSLQAAMEVILNFHRHPIKQERYFLLSPLSL